MGAWKVCIICRFRYVHYVRILYTITIYNVGIDIDKK